MTPGAPTDPFARRVYLQALPAPLPSTRYSHGARRRAAELQRFVRGLQRTAGRELALRGSLELVVVDAGDWRKLFGRTYGPAFARARPAGASVIAAADYPPRLLRRFDEVFLRAAQAGERAPLEAGACLDLWVGHAWGWAAAELGGLASGVAWMDELLAGYLWVGALAAGGADELLGRALALARVGVAGGLVPQGRGFATPASRLRFAELLYVRGALVLRAASLWRQRGWEFGRSLQGALAGTVRGEAVRVLREVEPGVGEWREVWLAGGGE